MPTPLATLLRTDAPAHAEITEKRSRFLAYITPCDTEEHAREVITELRARHRDARHHCTAFIIGEDARTQRSNDDGEPSGTAGAPILEALASTYDQPVTYTVATVVRWFGGVLLGTGGLVRAYGDATRAALAAAPITRYQHIPLWDIHLGHDVAGSSHHTLATAGFDVTDTAYLPTDVRLRVATCDAARLESVLAAAAGRPVRAHAAGAAWVPSPL